MSCLRPIMQGDEYFIGIQLTNENDEVISLDDIKAVEFILGELRWTYPSDDVSYDAHAESFYIRLTQEQTLNMFGKQTLQVRVKFTNDEVIGAIYGDIFLQYASERSEQI